MNTGPSYWYTVVSFHNLYTYANVLYVYCHNFISSMGLKPKEELEICEMSESFSIRIRVYFTGGIEDKLRGLRRINIKFFFVDFGDKDMVS